MKIKGNHRYFAFIFFLLFTVAYNTQAQQSQIYGFKAGISTTTLSNEGNFNIKPGLQAGVYAKLGGREALFFKSELLLTQKGAWKWGEKGLGNFSLYYLDLSLMFGIDIFENVSLNIGIQPSLLIGGTLRTTSGDDAGWRNVSNDLARVDFATLFGAEYDLNTDWFVGARFNYGFVPIQNYQGDLTIENNGKLLENRVFQLYIGHRLK